MTPTSDIAPLPDKVAAIKQRGLAVWAEGKTPANLADKFDDEGIPVSDVRHARIWGLQVDDERELPGHERTSIPDEEIWLAILVAKDGSNYEVNCDWLEPAPE